MLYKVAASVHKAKRNLNGLIRKQEGLKMNPMTNKEGIELEIQIEELEVKIAPDFSGGETVWPNPLGGHLR